MTTKEFIAIMIKDTEIAGKMSECREPEKAYAIAKEAGLTDDYETFKATMTKANEQLCGELSDEELAVVAGGSTGEMVAIGITAGLLISASA